MASGNEYNWEMTGPPSVQEQLGNPGAVESWNNFVESGGGGWQAETIGGGGAPDAGAVVTQMYQDVLGRAPDAGGYQAFVDAINSGADPGALAQSMAKIGRAHV